MKRSKFNLSHYQLHTADMGNLIPVGLTEVLPGDTIQHATSSLVRAMPLATPPMHNVNYRVHHWFVPHRIIWDDWEDFITGGPDNDNNSAFPTIALSNVAEKSLADNLGVPATFTGSVSALPFRAMALIWNENYRDQDLQQKLGLSLSSGVDVTTSTVQQNVCWEKDYFTESRPWEQKGPAITMPLGTTAPIVPTGPLAMNWTGSAGNRNVQAMPGTTFGFAGAAPAASQNATYASGLAADLSASSSVDVTTVREAFALQRYAEARARYGSRYTEYLAYLGVRSSDARLQRPEYLGGGRQSLQFSEVLQTGSTTVDGNGVGQLYGHGIAGMRTNRYRRYFEEHGYIVSVAYALPRTIYPQGLFRHWNRRVKEDFWQKELQHIGQQAILMKEIYALGANPDDTFSYGSRYGEYRRAESQVHGEFRTSLADWHFARLLAAQPTLNASFVSADPAKRPFQAQGTNSTLLIASHHQMVARRMVSGSDASFVF